MIRAAALLLLLLTAPPAAHAAAQAFSTLRPEQTRDLSFHQHMGAALPLGAQFRDATGAPVRLGDFFRGKPVILVLEYLRCRTLCGFVLQDAAAALSRVPLTAGKDYEVVAISIDPRDRPADARAARGKYLARFPAKGAAGWHFLTGGDRAIHAVADTVGFPFRFDPALGQYAHPAGIVAVTPQGRISRYILGVGYRPLDVRLALSEAGEGTVSSPVSDLLLLCYCYDPGTGRYSFAINTATRILCGATVLALGGMVLHLARARRS